MEELLVLVDEHGEEIGEEEKLAAHKKGLLHRAFSVFIWNDKGELLLQRRALKKYHSGGLWANACCSHPRSGESLEVAVHRRLQEELGFDCHVHEVFTFIYKIELEKGLFEHEYDHVFIGKYIGSVAYNPEEVEEVAWVTWDVLCNDVKVRPDRYAYWLKKIIEIVKEKKIESVFVKDKDET